VCRLQSVTDGGICILELAAQEFHFNCDQAATFIARVTDACSRINVLTLLQPRLVDLANLTAVVYAGMIENELRGLERKIGSLFYFTPTNPTGHYSLELANRYDRYIARKLIEISSEEKVYRKGLWVSKGSLKRVTGTTGEMNISISSHGLLMNTIRPPGRVFLNLDS
jgi:hypothetical protein